jgi:hypothetical protein
MKSLNLFILAGFILFASSCKKESTTTNTPPPVVNPTPDTTNTSKYRLMAVERRKDDSTLVYSIGFQYDASGRITRVFSPENNPQGILATIKYNGNEAVFSHPASNPLPGIFSTDTIWFTLDSENKALKRIEHVYTQNDDTLGSHPLRDYSFDTTTYEYNASGQLQKATQQLRDSTIWINNSVISMTNVLYSSIINHQISGGNVVAINKVTLATPGNNHSEKNVSFEYNNSYANNVAFSNPAIMNEMNLFYEWPLNNNYKNMPDKMTVETFGIDNLGNKFNSISATYLLGLTFDKNGYLGSYFDSNYTGGKWYYLYSK